MLQDSGNGMDTLSGISDVGRGDRQFSSFMDLEGIGGAQHYLCTAWVLQYGAMGSSMY